MKEVKLAKNHPINGHKFKKGTTIKVAENIYEDLKKAKAIDFGTRKKKEQ